MAKKFILDSILPLNLSYKISLMDEQNFEECTNKLLDLLASIEKVLQDPKNIADDDLNCFKESIDFIHFKVNK